MRMTLFAISLALGMLAGGRAATGAALFVRLAGETGDARADVYLRNFTGGEERRLIAHDALPPAFRGRITRAFPSADGALVLLEESDGCTIRDAKTGATRLVLGDGYTLTGSEALAGRFHGGYWLWTRATGAVTPLALAPGDDRPDVVGWSPRGARLLVVAGDDRKTGGGALRIIDAARGTGRALCRVGVLDFARWTADGSAVLFSETVRANRARLSLAPLVGTVKRLFTHPRLLRAANLSPDGRRVAFADAGGGCYLCSRSGTGKRRLALPAPQGSYQAMLAFSPDGARLALLATTTSAGLYATIGERLWVADAATARPRLLAQWETTLGNTPGVDSTHALLGWAADRRGLLVREECCTLNGVRDEWRKLWLQPVPDDLQAAGEPPARLLAETGPCGIDLACQGER